MKNERISQGFSIVSFDVKSLFTSVPLEKTIDIALERIYLRKEIVTILTKNEMKNLLILCTKNVHFTFNNDIYIQNDGVAMRSPLGPILAGIFMVELKNTLVPKLKQHIKTWRRYVDDTFVYVKNGSIEYVLLAPESIHPNIKFTYEKEVNNTLPFLDVLFITMIYTYIGMHLHLYLGNVEQSELWLIEPMLSALTIIIYSKS